MTFLPHLKTGVSTNITRDFRDQIRKADLDTAGNISWYAYDGHRSPEAQNDDKLG